MLNIEILMEELEDETKMHPPPERKRQVEKILDDHDPNVLVELAEAPEDIQERMVRKGDSFVNFRDKGDIKQLTRQRFFATSKEAEAFMKKVKQSGGKVVHSGITEADLTKPQIKKVHKMADELPKKDFKDRYGKEKGDAVRYATATNIVKKKLGIEENLGDIFMKKFAKKDNKADMMFKKLSQRAQTHVNDLLRTGMGTMDAIKKAKEKFNEGNMKNEEMRLRVEAIAGLKKKAEKSGMPYSILKKVYDRGMAAWKGGHRPGASQHQWAFARVNSFVTKSSGTWGGADKDLAKQVRGSK